MKQIDYSLLKESVFTCYESYMNLLRLTRDDHSKYVINVLRTLEENNLTRVEIKIDGNTDTGLPQKFLISTILNNEEVINLISDIRTDFRDQHYISYSSANEREKTQTLQNTNFTLKIELKNDEEVADAIEFNSRINSNVKRHVLSKA